MTSPWSTSPAPCLSQVSLGAQPRVRDSRDSGNKEGAHEAKHIHLQVSMIIMDPSRGSTKLSISHEC